MKQIIALILALFLIFAFTACNNSNENSHSNGITTNKYIDTSTEVITDNVDDTKKSDTPMTLMDLFDGEKRVWYLLQDENGLAYNSSILAVVITENKKVVEAYYTVNSGGWESIVEATLPHPFAPFLNLADFEGLTDIQILNMVKENYADISKTYDNCKFNFAEGVSTEFYGYPFKKMSLPFNIIYNGKLDASGNKLEYEKFKLFENSFCFQWRTSSGLGGVNNSIDNEFYYKNTIMPTIIKDKEYVGIKCNMNYMLITINDYESFSHIKFDSPAGATEW